ncbi:MAG TPA: hypothetical protein VGB85_17155, partial [Nannocystis sp.]
EEAPVVRAGEVPAAAPRGLPRRGRLLAGERVARVPRWPAAIDQATRERLPAPARAAVERSPVPVLVPADPGWLSSTQVFPGSWGYALAARDGEVTLALHASRIATIVPGVGVATGTHRVRGVDGFLSVNEGIRTASWIEHGVAYSLDLECRDPQACSEAALRAAVEGLVYVGGVGGGA